MEQKIEMNDELLTSYEVMEILKIRSYATFMKHKKAGKLPLSVGMSRQGLYWKSEILEILNKKK